MLFKLLNRSLKFSNNVFLQKFMTDFQMENQHLRKLHQLFQHRDAPSIRYHFNGPSEHRVHLDDFLKTILHVRISCILKYYYCCFFFPFHGPKISLPVLLDFFETILGQKVIITALGDVKLLGFLSHFMLVNGDPIMGPMRKLNVLLASCQQ